MNVNLKRQEVTSGRLPGSLKVNRQTSGGPPGAAYSLYSSDSEGQVSTLHRGLDRCAVLLDHILQADAAGLSSVTRTEGATGSKPPTPAGRKTLKKVPGKAVKGGAARRTNTTQGKNSAKRATTKTGVSGSGLHGRGSSTAMQTCAPGVQAGTRPRPLQKRGGRRPLPRDPPMVTEPLHAKQQVVSAGTHESRQGGRDEEDSVPVRDPGPHSSAADLPKSAEEEEEEEEEEASSSRKDLCTSREPKTAAGAERGSRCGLCPSCGSVLGLQGELESAQARLQQLQEDLGELRRALQDTQNQLRVVTAENAHLRTGLEFHRQKLLDSERVNSELASLAQHRLKEVKQLQSRLQGVADTPPDRIQGFLRSLSQAEPCTERVQTERGSAHGDGENPDLQTGIRQVLVRPRRIHSPSLCDSASSWSAWSARSTSTFDTRDEAAFRDGLAALDASIASLQRTFQLDLRCSEP